MKGKLIITSTVLSVLVLSFIIAGVFVLPSSIPFISSSPIQYDADVCVYKNNELVECSHNLLYTSGENMVRDCLSDTGACDAITNISICNATVPDGGCQVPIIAGSETFTEFEDCGFNSVLGTTENFVTDGNWSISTTFTSSCDGQKTNSTRLGNSTGSDFAGNTFTDVTLNSLDTLTINWTIGIS